MLISVSGSKLNTWNHINMEDKEDITTKNQSAPKSALLNIEVMAWGGAALVLAILMVSKNTASFVLAAGFFAKFFALIVGTLMGWAGALIGNAIRKFVQPDSVFTNGGFFHLLWVKIFWMLGPQVIGLIIGTAIGISLVLR